MCIVIASSFEMNKNNLEHTLHESYLCTQCHVQHEYSMGVFIYVEESFVFL